MPVDLLEDEEVAVQTVIKRYVLLDHMHPQSNNVYVRISKTQRQKKNTLREFSPRLKVTFTGVDGKVKTIRYKENANSFYLKEQIADGIPANEPFTFSERTAMSFKEGEFSTDNPKIQQYLELYPGCEGFKGRCNEIPRPQYRVIDEQAELDAEDKEFEKRLEVANMIKGLDLEDAQNLLIRLIGAHITKPTDIKSARKMLVDYMNSLQSDRNATLIDKLDEMLEQELSEDEIASVLVNRLVGDGQIKFDVKEGQVTKKRGDRFINIKAIEAKDDEEMKARFVEFLTSDAGKNIYNELKKIKR